MPIGPFSAGAVLGAIAALVGAGVPFWYRYVYGSRSRVSVSRLTTIDDSKWRDGTNDDKPVWSRRILVRAANDGWRDGVIGDVELEQVVVCGEDGGRTGFSDPADGIHKIALEHFSPDGESTRLSIQQRTDYGGQIVSGRDDELMGVLPFILRDSDLGEAMQKGKRAEFTFTFTVEDNERIYSSSVDVTTELTDSAGGALADSK